MFPYNKTSKQNKQASKDKGLCFLTIKQAREPKYWFSNGKYGVLYRNIEYWPSLLARKKLYVQRFNERLSEPFHAQNTHSTSYKITNALMTSLSWGSKNIRYEVQGIRALQLQFLEECRYSKPLKNSGRRQNML